MLGSNCRLAAWALLGTIVLGGCDTDLTVPLTESAVDRAAVVLNRGDRTLTAIPFAESAPRTVQLGAVAGLGDLAMRGDRALVPVDGGVLVVNLRTEGVERRLALPAAPDAQRVAYLGDTLALVASPGAGTITAVNPLTGRVAPSTTAGGAGPLDVVQLGARIFVLNSPPAPAAPAITVLDTLLRRTGEVALSGTGARMMVLRGSQLFVLHAGAPGTAGGSLSIVDTGSLREVSLVPGFGESPESMAFGSGGELYVAVPGRGLAVFDAATRRVTRGLDAPLAAGGLDRVSRLAADPAGFVYALQPGACDRPGTLVRLDAGGAPAVSVPTGVCPVDVEFAQLPRR